jgi:hypothetical protein
MGRIYRQKGRKEGRQGWTHRKGGRVQVRKGRRKEGSKDT